MSVVALVVNEHRTRALQAARQAVTWLEHRGHQVRMPLADARAMDRDDLGVADEALAPGADLALSLGGDGTMLRTVQLVLGQRVPVLGVNLGRLGYLASVDPTELTAALDAVLHGQGAPGPVDERALVEVNVGSGEHYLALNEVVIEKPSAGQPVRLSLDVDGDHLASYVADGLILSSPTGSTAYAFSARGPILSPNLRALLVTPVAPHLPFDRSVVLAEDESVTITILGHRPASVTIDGQEMTVLQPQSTVTCGVARQGVALIAWGRPSFYQLLRAKFSLNDDPGASTSAGEETA